jgi:hypothetical protein
MGLATADEREQSHTLIFMLVLDSSKEALSPIEKASDDFSYHPNGDSLEAGI